MAKKVPVIKIPRGQADKICMALKIGRTTLYEALNYQSDSDNAKRTREVVLAKYGGIKTTKVNFNQ
jgi:hypothetical protein